ncbi:ribonuclease E/G [Parvularcula lutaonensis]|uniref:Ribonuclease E/G n=1 Tax=Parvularcula lutaonensis TaxID=491923 RepID=A0ABV7MGN7_9PROT|nr:ribonuclease E/G [Parvularcula lutaonensis]GGY54697.1 hypothetical protein GCM10007148_25510 [Parvularcula lutaonensis]
MSTSILVEETPFGVRGLLMDAEGRALRLAHRFATRSGYHAGDLVWASAGKRDKRLGSQLFDLGGGMEAMLPVKDRQYPEGKLILAGVRREAIGDKRVVLTDKPSLRLPAAVLRADTPEAEARPGILGQEDIPKSLREQLAKPAKAPGPAVPVHPAVALVTTLARRDLDRIGTSSGALAAQLKAFLPDHIDVETIDRTGEVISEAEDEALERVVGLEGGGSLVIDETEALTAIDVDLGHIGGQSQKGAADHLRRAAFATLGRAITLRALGGQVVLDLPRAAVRVPKMLREQLTAILKTSGLVSIPAATKEGLVFLLFGRDRRSILEDLTQATELASVREGRVFAPDMLAWRAYCAAHLSLSGNRTARFAVSLPGPARKVWEKQGASEALAEVFGARVSLSQGGQHTFDVTEVC